MENQWVDFEKALLKKRYLKSRKILQANEGLIPLVMDDFFTTNDVRKSQHYARFLDKCKTNYRHLLVPYFRDWINHLKTSEFDSFLRNSYRYFQYVDVPEELQGELYGLAFEKFMNPNSAIAIRVFSMTTCYNIAKHYKDLQQELIEAIYIVREEDISAGMLNRSGKLLKKMGEH